MAAVEPAVRRSSVRGCLPGIAGDDEWSLGPACLGAVACVAFGLPLRFAFLRSAASLAPCIPLHRLIAVIAGLCYRRDNAQRERDGVNSVAGELLFEAPLAYELFLDLRGEAQELLIAHVSGEADLLP